MTLTLDVGCGWKLNLHAFQVIATALLEQIPERTLDSRAEGLFLVELGKASGVEVIEYLLVQVRVVLENCTHLRSVFLSFVTFSLATTYLLLLCGQCTKPHPSELNISPPSHAGWNPSKALR